MSKTTSLKQVIRKSNARIDRALTALNETERGRKALKDFKTFALGDAMGLDSAGQKAMIALVEEFFLGHRREFLTYIP